MAFCHMWIQPSVCDLFIGRIVSPGMDVRDGNHREFTVMSSVCEALQPFALWHFHINRLLKTVQPAFMSLTISESLLHGEDTA